MIGVEGLTALQQAGVLGTMCALFAGVIVFLWRHFTTERTSIIAECAKDRKAAEDKLTEERAQFATERISLLEACAQERRDAEAKLAVVNAERIADNKAVAEKQLSQMREIVRALDSVQSTGDMMRASIEELSDTLRGKTGS